MMLVLGRGHMNLPCHVLDARHAQPDAWGQTLHVQPSTFKF
jgi:hypothetical protein